MNKIGVIITVMFCGFYARAQSPLPKVVSGRIERIENFKSRYVSSRNIDVWLPEGYSDSIKYSVLYMHDGQMLYDPDNAWNKQVWDVDDVASELMKSRRIKKFIVVGIWNDGQARHMDYFPQKPFDQLTQIKKDTVRAQLKRAGRAQAFFKPQSDNYLNFIVLELKPYVDKNYSVHTTRENTFIAGSSMGGLISMYAVCEYPKIFGGAACLSTHWVGTFLLNNNPMPDSFIDYLNKNIPDPKQHKIYFDCGDQTLDAMYPPIQRRIDSLMKKKGFNSHHWLTEYFPGADHSEKSWNKRLSIPLSFLFNTEAP